MIDNIQYYQSSKTINQFALDNGVFDWGGLQQFTWNVKLELDNIMLTRSNVDETLGSVEVGRIVDEISGAARGEIAKISRDGNGNITRIYLRSVSTGASFSDGDRCLGSNGFTFTISADPRSLNGIFYIDFGPSAAKFGNFVPGQFYFAPENIRVKRNYLIVINQSDASNGSGTSGHIQCRFSTTLMVL